MSEILRALAHPLVAVLLVIGLVEAVITQVVLGIAAPDLRWWVVVICCTQSATVGAVAALLLVRRQG